MRKRRKNDKRVIITAAAAVIIITGITIGVIIGIMNCKPNNKYYVLSEAEIAKAISENVYETDERRLFVESALSLIGKVRYFWGGKCYIQGEDPDWGNMRIVTSKGHSTSGTAQPCGLDCSGFVSWCFIQLGYDRAGMEEYVGNGTWNQWQKSEPIEKEEMKPGDLAFANRYPGAKGNHVGICIGFLKGEPLIAHCSDTEDNVVVTSCGELFNYFRRPSFFASDNG